MAANYVTISTPPIQTTEVTSTTNATTTSGTDALMTGMTITPIQGTYLVMFSSVVQSSGAGQGVTVSLYVGGTQDATSVRDAAPFDGGTLSATQASCGIMTHGIYTVNGSQAIAVEWHVSGGTATVFQRKLSVIKIG
jgi:hypothetical protein